MTYLICYIRVGGAKERVNPTRSDLVVIKEDEMKTETLDLVSVEELSVEDLPESVSAGASTASSYACIGSVGTCAGTLSTLSSVSG